MKETIDTLIMILLVMIFILCGAAAAETAQNEYSMPVITVQPRSVTTEAGTTVTFTVEAAGQDYYGTGLRYQWYLRMAAENGWQKCSLSGSHTASLSIKALPTRNGWQYKCIISNAEGTVCTDVVTLTVIDCPAITSHPKSVETEINKTAQFTVTATGNDLTYRWQVYTGADGGWKNSALPGHDTPTLSVKAAASRDGYQYRCIVSNGNLNAISCAAKLTIVSIPVFTQQPWNTAVKTGETATFRVTASGADLRYRWQVCKSADGAWENCTHQGNRTNVLSVPAEYAYNGYQYRCVVWNTIKQIVSRPAALTVYSKPVITTQPQSVTVEAGTTVTFTVEATGTDEYFGTEMFYQWYMRTSADSSWQKCSLSGADTASLSVKALPARNGWQYKCLLNNLEGNTYSDIVTLTIPDCPAIVSQPQSVKTEVNTTVQFTVAATGENLSYRWQVRPDANSSWKNSTLAGYDTPTLSVKAMPARDGYQYRCIVSNGNVSLISRTAKLTITSIPYLCVLAITDESVTLSVRVVGTGFSYRWQVRTSDSGTWKNSTLPGSDTDVLTVTMLPEQSGYQYRCKVTKDTCTMFSQTVTLPLW